MPRFSVGARTDARDFHPVMWVVGLLGVLVVAVGIVVWLTWSNSSPDLGTVSPAEVASHKEEFFGQEMVLTGTMTDSLGPRAFGLGGVLIITPEPVPADATLGHAVTAEGTVRRFDEDVVRAVGGVPVDTNVLSGWRDQPMMVASNVIY